jgi:hypothetical protein
VKYNILSNEYRRKINNQEKLKRLSVTQSDFQQYIQKHMRENHPLMLKALSDQGRTNDLLSMSTFLTREFLYILYHSDMASCELLDQIDNPMATELDETEELESIDSSDDSDSEFGNNNINKQQYRNNSFWNKETDSNNNINHSNAKPVLIASPSMKRSVFVCHKQQLINETID